MARAIVISRDKRLEKRAENHIRAFEKIADQEKRARVEVDAEKLEYDSGNSATTGLFRVLDREVVSQATWEGRRCQVANNFCSTPPIRMGGAVSVSQSSENVKKRLLLCFCSIYAHVLAGKMW